MGQIIRNRLLLEWAGAVATSESEKPSFRQVTIDPGTVADCLAVFGTYRMVTAVEPVIRPEPKLCSRS